MAARPRKVAAHKDWAVFKRHPGLVLGFHGCDRAVGEAVLAGDVQHLKVSANAYDWLGEGIYFWEADPWRALQFAQEAQQKKHLTKGDITDPYVIGAVIDLGYCCNLMEAEALDEVRGAWRHLSDVYEYVIEGPMPVNKGEALGLRLLDNAVLDTMHKLRRRRGMRPYDSTRSAFHEGEPLYPKAGFNLKNHIQIAVHKVDCVLGYFRLAGF